ncbi:cupin domain-containing protein [Amycolatopsis jejuensis]|uniref:cupin domain-containing protein n=1 Tax=Amycolatopsis jejuensis TaxID=330084 RepID=UPI000689EFDF|nr:cupin domain-containing protein [Amycolatopsis jejuensis]
MDKIGYDEVRGEEDPAGRFTGTARLSQVDSTWRTDESARLLMVQYEPGARTKWHTHEGDQILVGTSGEGLVQAKGEKAVPIRAGDIVVCRAGETHWHGAAPGSAFTHLAVTQGGIDWHGPVED